MPYKPNYKFERYERAKAKADKKAQRLEAKVERREAKKNADATDLNENSVPEKADAIDLDKP